MGHSGRGTLRGNFGWLGLLLELLNNQPEITEWSEHSTQPQGDSQALYEASTERQLQS